MFILEIVFFAIVGLMFGSFATAIIYREPLDIPWAALPFKDTDKSKIYSACRVCKAQLKTWDLIPVFSWILKKGRCSSCGVAISKTYPLTELGCMLAACFIYFHFGLTAEAFFLLIAVPFLAALFVIDLQHMLLPNRLVFILALIGLARLMLGAFVFETIEPALIGMNYILGGFVFGILAWFLSYIFKIFLKKDALGFGDVKFFAVAGVWLGVTKLADFCILAGVIGVLLALLWRFVKQEEVFPFGPALILSFFILLFVEGSLFV